MNFMIKDNSELIYNKKHLKAEKRLNTKKLSMLSIPVIFFDLVYRKNGNCYPKVFLEKFIHNFFWRSMLHFEFWGSGRSS